MREGEPHFEKDSPETALFNEEEFLKTAEIQEKRAISEKGINEVCYVAFKDGGAGIFKPKSGEKPVPQMEKVFPAGTYYKRERAAYLVDKSLGFGVVPPTEIRTIDGEEGSIQKFVENAMPLNLLPQEEKNEPEVQKQLAKAWVLHYIINQSDSAEENFLVSSGKVSAIDHGLSFEKTVTDFDYDNFWKQPIPEDLGQSIRGFFKDEKSVGDLKNFLSELLSTKEVDACLSRAKKVLKFLQK